MNYNQKLYILIIFDLIKMDNKLVFFINILVVCTTFTILTLTVCLSSISIHAIIATIITGLATMVIILFIIQFITFNQVEQQPLIDDNL